MSDTVVEVYSLGIKCPKCGAGDWSVTGLKGGVGKGVAVTAAFGAIGSMVASSMAKDDDTQHPVSYRCRQCNHKFESWPERVPPEQKLEKPCTVNFTRLSSFVGMAVAQFVYINGMKIGPVKNGKTLTFRTLVRDNVVFVTDQFGAAFRSDYRFQAQPGGTEDIKFKRKFKTK